MKEYDYCHKYYDDNTNERFFSELDSLDDKDQTACDCIVFNLQSDFYRR